MLERPLLFTAFCLCLSLLLPAPGAGAEQRLKLGLGAPEEAISLTLPEQWQPVSDARFAELAGLAASLKNAGSSRLVQAWELAQPDGSRSGFLVTSMPTGRFPEAQLVEYERLAQRAPAQKSMRYDRALNVVWTPGQVSRRGSSTLSAIIPTERGSILLQAMGDRVDRLSPFFERVVRSASVSDPLRYRHGERVVPTPPRPDPDSYWGTLVGIVVAGLLVSLWSHFAATLPRGWPRAMRQMLVLLASLGALGLLTSHSVPQSADAGVAFLYALVGFVGLRALGSRLQRA